MKRAAWGFGEATATCYLTAASGSEADNDQGEVRVPLVPGEAGTDAQGVPVALVEEPCSHASVAAATAGVAAEDAVVVAVTAEAAVLAGAAVATVVAVVRSEERRVGKECRN